MPRLRIVSELEHGRHKSTSSVIPEVLFWGGRLFDASHRVGSRSAELKQGLALRSLNRLFDASHRVSSRSAELE